MKQKIIILFTIYLLFNSALSAQNIEKMNKSELREHTVILTTKIDSLKNENINLQESISNLSTNSSLLEQKNKTNEVEISRINELILKNEDERKRIISENNIATSKLNEIILKNEDERKRIISENKIATSKLNEIITTLKNSISSVQSSSNVVSTSTTYNSNDFLNRYYFDQIPLPNNSFSLVLSKLVYGKTKENSNSYYDDVNKGSVERLPEILDPNAFNYWGAKPNVKTTRGTKINDYVISKNSDYFNSKLPKIEILKNKLFTIKYNDGSEESFLFNVRKYVDDYDENNQRKILQIELANEEVKADGSNNTAKDIIWRFFAIENECYLALTLGQLNRLNLKLTYFKEGIQVSDIDHKLIYFQNNFNEGYEYTTTGEGIYLSRNKDLFMASSKYIDPKDIIYLFKLK